MTTIPSYPAHVPVSAAQEYTLEELLAHLHDRHGRNAEEQSQDEESNGFPDVAAQILAMSRNEVIDRLKFHHGLQRLEDARALHDQDHAEYAESVVWGHFHPGAKETP